MYNYFINFPVPVIAVISTLLPVFFILNKLKEKYVLIFWATLLIKLIFDLNQLILASNIKNSLFLDSLNVLFLTNGIIFTFYQTKTYEKYKKFLILVSLLFTCLGILDMYLSNKNLLDIQNFRTLSYTYPLHSTIIIGLICFFFYRLIQEPIIPDLFTYPMFYICSGLLLIHCSSVFLSILFNSSHTWESNHESILYIPYIFEIISNLLISLGFYNGRRNLEVSKKL